MSDRFEPGDKVVHFVGDFLQPLPGSLFQEFAQGVDPLIYVAEDPGLEGVQLETDATEVLVVNRRLYGSENGQTQIDQIVLCFDSDFNGM